MLSAGLLLLFLPLVLSAPAQRSELAPLLVPRNGPPVEGMFIVRMKKSAAKGASVASAVSSIASDAHFTYSHAFSGFAASLKPDEVEKLRANPDVDYIEQDAVVTIFETQNDADWGLARLSNKKPNATTYNYDDTAGEGTCAYVIDTGIDAKNSEFEGRAKFVANYADKEDGDGHGHGTHVAGTIGSKTYGVAKKTTLLGVKVLDANGSGRNSAVIAGMDFVAKDAAKQKCPKGIVVNMSLGGSFSKAVNSAAANIVKAGLFLAVAAGNDGADASGYSPASEPSACTVGATTRVDALASYSNIGSIVDVLAPGSNITSTWVGGKTKSISGTSMASPHVAGIGAYFLGAGEKVDGLCQHIAKQALEGAVSGVPGDTKNLLINNGYRKS
ncbi:putative subtilisin-like protease [Ophiocordyceps polyrhachis-furcata BCC 54312]|uniref:Subtilisin-like protease n=1 Tax=Ophiocordyceps polyrhachis-furcata BCC 54312 TaxID=1330021 RepID=A0A367LB15_9HYPO|nr:putative subtilisin-like protease [Ophiocordyceps polyrhachis-furcata BCC 54312]